jgi:hypothetical protein
MQRKVKEDRMSLINAGMNNLNILGGGGVNQDLRSNAYKDLNTGFKIARSAAVSPSHSALALVSP